MVKKELCIIHIGMPKTGSSALQESLFLGIPDERVSYANLPDACHHIRICSLFNPYPESYYYNLEAGRNKEQIEVFNTETKRLLIEGFLNFPSAIEIISGEDIYNMGISDLINFRDFLSQFFHRIIIVGYARPLKSFIESLFQQAVKFHNLDNLTFSSIYPHYKKFEKFDTVFGKDNVKLWKFEPARFPNGDITLDFCKKLGIQYTTSQTYRTNETLSREAISLLFVFNKYGTSIDLGVNEFVIQNKLVECIRSIGTLKLRFSNKLFDSFLNEYKNDLEWIESRMGESLDEQRNEFDDDISSEEDLLQFSDETIDALKNIIGKDALPKEEFGKNPQDIAKLVDALKQKLAVQEGFLIKKQEQLSGKERGEYNTINTFHLNWESYFQINAIKDNSIDPIIHYIKNWHTQDLIIENTFDTGYYLELYPDVKISGMNPLFHYLDHGIKEGRKGIEKK